MKRNQDQNTFLNKQVVITKESRNLSWTGARSLVLKIKLRYTQHLLQFWEFWHKLLSQSFSNIMNLI